MDEVPSHARGQTANPVKNKAPAKVQITAEQLLREAWERKESGPAALPKHQIADREELLDYQRNERKQYEMRIVRNRSHTPLWIRYARWEEEQQEFVRARSIWERAIDNDYRNPVIWLNYAEMEMRHRFINHARNVLDRAVALLPRVDQLWLKYAHMEEMLNQHNLARLVYQRWLKWFPENTAYFAFIRFELRHSHTDNARGVYNELLIAHRTAHSYIKFAKFEERQEEYARARNIYERASEELPSEQLSVGFFLSFAKFEERRKQPARVRAIYKFAAASFPKEAKADLERAYTNFEKQQGEREALDDLLISKKRAAYEARLSADPTDYDTWFDLLQMEENSSTHKEVRATYERAITESPPVASKAAWSRYVYLWLSYAVWLEVACNDLPAAIQIYKRCVQCIPSKHRKFSFGKLWVLYAQAELRRGDLAGARRVLGAGLGVLPNKHVLYRVYIELETALGEVDRARRVYEMWLTRNPTYAGGFLELADMEMRLGEVDRARRVLELATKIDELDDAPGVWERLALVVRSASNEEEAIQEFEKYVKENPDKHVWLAYISMLNQNQSAPEAIRRVYERGLNSLREEALTAGPQSVSKREDALDIAERWLAWEMERANSVEKNEADDDVERARRLVPKRVRRQRTIEARAGAEPHTEEYWQVLFPEEDVGSDGSGRKLLEAARQWKMRVMSQENRVSS